MLDGRVFSFFFWTEMEIGRLRTPKLGSAGGSDQIYVIN